MSFFVSFFFRERKREYSVKIFCVGSVLGLAKDPVLVLWRSALYRAGLDGLGDIGPDQIVARVITAGPLRWERESRNGLAQLDHPVIAKVRVVSHLFT